jgi:hypothetical protein
MQELTLPDRVFQSVNLGGYVRRAIDILAARHPVSLAGRPTPEIEKASEHGRASLCILAWEFQKAGKAEELGKLASDEPLTSPARHLLERALLAGPYHMRRSGLRATVAPEGKEAWVNLQRYVRDLLLGDPTDTTTVCEDIRRICDAAINRLNIQNADCGGELKKADPEPQPASSIPPTVPAEPEDTKAKKVLHQHRKKPKKRRVAAIRPCPADATEILARIPALGSVKEIAQKLGYPTKAKPLNTLLGRYRKNHPDCANEVEDRRLRETKWLYRTSDVVTELVAWIERLRKRPKTK